MRGPGQRLSPARRRGLLRLIAVLAALVLVVVVISNSGDGSGGPPAKPPAGPVAEVRTPVAHLAARRLPAPVSGEAVTSQSDGRLLVIGGLDASAASASGIFRLDPRTLSLSPVGALAEPLHDAAAAPIARRVLVFGGGSTTTTDAVESLPPGGTGRVVGHLPEPRSDLSAVSVGARTYILGGYDGQSPVGSVLETSDGRRFATVAQLPTPVRYAAVAALGGTVYAFGGELADGRDSDTVQAIDTRGQGARVVGRLPKPTSHASAVPLGGRIYVLGGRTGGTATSRILAFDPAGRTVSRAGRLPLAVTNAAAATSGARAYLIGGLGPAGRPLSSVITVQLESHTPAAAAP